MKLSQLHSFPKHNDAIKTPTKFPYLYANEPHELCRIASEELQQYLQQQTTWNKQLGVNSEPHTVGKMFGVLVVQQTDGSLHYLAGFSGAIGTCNTHPHFVPPIFNLLNPHGFFKQGEKELDILNAEIKTLEQCSSITSAEQQIKKAKIKLEKTQAQWKETLKMGKDLRKKQRIEAPLKLVGDELSQKLEELNRDSQLEKIKAKKHIAEIQTEILSLEKKLQAALLPLSELKELRKKQSAQLQQDIFEEFKLLNCQLESKSVSLIFKEQGEDIPPAGTGDCAAPKLLQFAFKHQLKPIALAEFWWGAPPKSEIRKHKQFYPPCQNKCAPIMAHMLKYIEQEANPLIDKIAQHPKIDIIYEDNWLMVINKPNNCLSVPGKTDHHSILQEIKKLRPHAEGALLVHRLDMATSGVLLAAKDPETHKYLQQQFIKRSTQKCYTAILDGTVENNEGVIDLPLRVDLNNRPRQLVCHEHGKSARTQWKVLERKNGKTRIAFFPITGRTHQLRVHAAHVNGLHAAIIGDELYGKPADRLYLHAHWLKIIHPHTKEEITFTAPEPF